MSNAVDSSNTHSVHDQLIRRNKTSSGGAAIAAMRHGAPPDSAGLTCSSPRPVIRGESPPNGSEGNEFYPIDSNDENIGHSHTANHTDVLRQRTQRRGSIRVNLSVPCEMDDVLQGLSDKTGSSKASFVMQALHAFLPELQTRLSGLGRPQPNIQRRQTVAPAKTAQQPPHFSNLTRQQRRKMEREVKKAEKGGARG